jgi:beta-glucosidase-like glycosyl hydrolase
MKSLIGLLLLCVLAAPPHSAAEDWVETTLHSMTVEQKVGQLFVVELLAIFANEQSPEYRYAVEMVRTYHVGGFVLAAGTVNDIALTANALQKHATVPLIINADLEAGLNVAHPWRWNRGWTERLPAYVSGGGTAFPPQMAVGATGDPARAEEAGRITAREARAVGILWINAPVADVSNNPANPIVSIRSFGEDPRFVARMVQASVRGVQGERVMATLKHFPGHGDTEQDSHAGLPVLPFDQGRLDSVELVPFRAGIEAGAKCVMTGHLALPRIDSSGRPATLSRKILTGLLREKLGFQGIIVTDAMRMQGITDLYGSGEAAVLAIEAGADVILIPQDVAAAHGAVLGAVRSGRIPLERLNASVRRILEAKAWTGLDRMATVDLEAVPRVVARPEHVRAAQEISDASVALLRNRGVIPVRPGTKTRLVVLSEDPIPGSGLELRRILNAPLGEVGMMLCTNETGPERLQEIRDSLRKADVAVVAAYLTIRAWKGAHQFSRPLQGFLDSLATLAPKVVTVAFGDPYFLGRLPETDAVMTPFNTTVLAERSIARVILGEIPPLGRLPVTIPRAGEPPFHDTPHERQE